MEAFVFTFHSLIIVFGSYVLVQCIRDEIRSLRGR